MSQAVLHRRSLSTKLTRVMVDTHTIKWVIFVAVIVFVINPPS